MPTKSLLEAVGELKSLLDSVRQESSSICKGWVTLEPSGTHVYIDGDSGTITAGPAHMTGKKPSELSGQHVGAEHGERHPETGEPGTEKPKESSNPLNEVLSGKRKPTLEEFQELLDQGYEWDEQSGWTKPKLPERPQASATVSPEVHQEAARNLDDSQKELISDSHDWERTKPWNLTEDQVRNNPPPGVRFTRNPHGEVAHYSQGVVWLSPQFFQPPMSNHEDARRHVIYHELGHLLADTMVQDSTSFQLHDAGVIPAKHDMGSGVSGGHGDEEALADAYALLNTDPDWLRQRYPQLMEVVEQRAQALGLPLPSTSRSKKRDKGSQSADGGMAVLQLRASERRDSGTRSGQGRLQHGGLSGAVHGASASGDSDGDLRGSHGDAIASSVPTKAHGLASLLPSLPPDLAAHARSHAEQHFATLAASHGQERALSILSAGLESVPLPADVTKAAPLIGAAELYLRLRGEGKSLAPVTLWLASDDADAASLAAHFADKPLGRVYCGLERKAQAMASAVAKGQAGAVVVPTGALQKCMEGENAGKPGPCPQGGNNASSETRKPLTAEQIKPGRVIERPETESLVGGRFVVSLVDHATGDIYGHEEGETDDYYIGNVGEFYEPSGEAPAKPQQEKPKESEEEISQPEPAHEVSDEERPVEMPAPESVLPADLTPVDSSHVKDFASLKKAAKQEFGVDVTQIGAKNKASAVSRWVYEDLAMMKQSGWNLPAKLKIESNFKSRAGYYEFASSTVALNGTYLTQYRDPAMRTSEVPGWSSVSRYEFPASSLVHETGHSDHADKLRAVIGEDGALAKFREWSSVARGLATVEGKFISKATFKKIAGEVSQYAAANPLEFVAEVYTGKRFGKEYSSKVEALYRELGGP